MRGDDRAGGDALFSYVSVEARVPPSHPLRVIRAVWPAAGSMDTEFSPPRPTPRIP